ncbi:DsbA family protein [Spelaeicoccus albus]|uniref:Protein-disulfide isomerase n=1 Tax=Spelaeicoccus albus TaxID=1280376 RepID=A0A7Z0A993_9MICO|nr:thioredoxin domain-containing protein [Spelaeicoccus albus]NYI65956.1 protein-disulfide isomerase [Spelaeicoccus albus]
MPSGKSNKNNRASAREQARRIAEVQARKERASKIWLRGGVVALIVAVAVVIVVIVATSQTDAPKGHVSSPSVTPSTYVDGGITFGKGDTPIAPPGTKNKDVPKSLEPANSKTLKKGAAHLVVYLDLQCPVCKSFEQINGAHIQHWAKTGNVAVEYRPIAFLDDSSNGNRYSSRAANAMGCVADSQPKKYMHTLTTMFGKQPEENGHGMTDQQLIAGIKSAGVDVNKKIDTSAKGKNPTVAKCISGEFFKKSVAYNTSQALKKISATPTVLLNGKEVSGKTWQDANKFSIKVLKAAGALDDSK